jgi:TetR/AcrR family transcriptional regulator, tetracycline repressor protein
MMVRFGATCAGEPNVERYYAFGIELLINGVEASARPTS